MSELESVIEKRLIDQALLRRISMDIPTGYQDRRTAMGQFQIYLRAK